MPLFGVSKCIACFLREPASNTITFKPYFLKKEFFIEEGWKNNWPGLLPVHTNCIHVVFHPGIRKLYKLYEIGKAGNRWRTVVCWHPKLGYCCQNSFLGPRFDGPDPLLSTIQGNPTGIKMFLPHTLPLFQGQIFLRCPHVESLGSPSPCEVLSSCKEGHNHGLMPSRKPSGRGRKWDKQKCLNPYQVALGGALTRECKDH